METPSPPSPPGKSTDDVSPVVPQAPTDPPPLANTGPTSTTSATALDLSMFPTALQAQLAQFTVDLQDYKSARTSLACNHCRLRKIKCSGDRPVCSACLKSGAGRETCQYPHGHAKRRKRSAIAIDSVRTVEEEDTSSTRTIKRHHSEVGDGTSLVIEQTSSTSSSSSNRFQTLRSAATLPPTKKARIEDIQTQQTEATGHIQDVNVEPHHRGASDVDRTGSQLRQQTEHEQSQGGDYDWSFFGDMHGPTPTMLSQQSHGQAEPSRTQRQTAYEHNHVEGGGGRRSKSVQGATKGTDREPGCGRSTRLRVPYFR